MSLLWLVLLVSGTSVLSGMPQVGHTDVVGRPDDVELASDLVGVASARLLAAGVSRGDRLGAMRLLGILATVADSERRVRRPLEDVALEFALPPGLAREWAGYLEDVGVIRREGTSTVLAGAEPAYVGALRLQDFLDAAAEMDEPHKTSPTRLLRPVGAALAAAAVLLAILLAPGVVHQRTTTTSSGGGSGPATPTTTMVPSIGQTSTSSGTVPPAGRTATGSAPTPVGPAVQPTTPTTLSLICPSGSPILQVLGSTTDSDGKLAVDGVAQNLSDADMQIESFTVRTTINGQDISALGADRPIIVPAHASILWEAKLPVLAPAGTAVRVTLGDWSWHAPNVPSSCPSP
jgi:hypothetical protein